MKIKRSKNYNRMMRRNKLNILRIAKKAAKNPFEYDYAIQLLLSHIKFMNEYYSLGENVVGEDIISDNLLSRSESIKKVLEIYTKLEQMNDDYIEEVNSENKKNFLTEYENLWNKFWSLIAYYIRYWWD